MNPFSLYIVHCPFVYYIELSVADDFRTLAGRFGLGNAVDSGSSAFLLADGYR